jgi:hydroxyethylthiazole kinase-like uncharacterized protein yjeF
MVINMYYAADSDKMKQIDWYSTEVIKIPAIVLMERAAAEVAAFMKQKIEKKDRILAVCGMGNNGGDGIATARILYLQGYQVALFLLGEETKATQQIKTQLEIAKNIGIPFETCNKLDEYNIIIDGIFGVGLSREVTGEQQEAIVQINRDANMVFSIDMPSGISADTGNILNCAVCADYTITFGYQKQGLLLYPGTEYAGEVVVADIGFPDIVAQKVKLDTFFYGKEDLCRLPIRSQRGHKGSFGRVLVIAGSKGMSGAAYLSAKAAYKSGAGLVKVLTATDNQVILQSLLPEALYASYDEEFLKDMGCKDEKLLKKWENRITAMFQWASVIVIGPGLGQTQLSKKLLDFVIKSAGVPVIIDADGINLLAKQLDDQTGDMESRLKRLAAKFSGPVVFTPHLMELSRLTGALVTELSNNIIDIASQCSYNNNLIYVIKDARTVVVQHNRRYINVSGNSGMATGGSGDVLTGIIAGLVAQKMPLYEAACLAVYIHGIAGDHAAEKKGEYSMMAGDIADFIGEVMQKNSYEKRLPDMDVR